jgi:translation initiation factor 1
MQIMSKKKIQLLGGLVYSTDPDFKLPDENFKEQETIEPSLQQLKIRLDTKHRAGKAVTLIENFAGTVSDMELLGKKLKSFCGTGGSVKDGEIIVQGDNREKILQWLQKNGYKSSKKI